jgi:ribonuclease HI
LPAGERIEVGARRTVSVTLTETADVLRVLVGKLPDELLQEYFKDKSPVQVRNILAEALKILTPRKDDAPPSRLQATLWEDKEKTWKGGLAGHTLQLYTDGASRGNPGEAGAGIAILDDQGKEIVATGKYLGKCTNNEAEYRALLYGLTKCAEFGSGRINVYLDSELIVKQIHGMYKVKHPGLKKLYDEAMQRVADFAAVQVAHVRREKNSRADELANQAIDKHLN